MGDVGASDDNSLSISASPSSATVTRLIQHAILQLCNEHVGYEHTLQVLGVLCVTVDDRHDEIVVKVNNTLKRVDAVSSATTRHGSVVRISNAVRGGTSAELVSCSSSGTPTGNGSVSSPLAAEKPLTIDSRHFTVSNVDSSMRLNGDNESRCSSPGHAENHHPFGQEDSPVVIVDDMPSGGVSGSTNSTGGRKCHGRKQSNPVKVKNISADDAQEAREFPRDGDDRDEGASPALSLESFQSGNEPLPMTAEKLTDRQDMMGVSQIVGQRLLGNKRTSGEALGLDCGRSSRHDTGMSSSMTVRALLANLSSSRNGPEVRRSNAHLSPSSASVQELALEDGLRRTPIEKKEERGPSGASRQQDAALNFSMDALDQRPRSSDHEESKSYGANGVKVKEEYHSAFPSAYSLDYLLGAAAAGGTPYDLSQIMTNYGSFLGENQFLSMPSGFDPHHLALVYSSLAASGGLGVPPALNNVASTSRHNEGSIVGGVTESGGGSVAVSDQARRYSVANRLNNGLTMHLSRNHPAAIRRRNRFARLLGGGGAAAAGGGASGATGPGKVKDIIMYDESAPLHAQRGSRIEGDFMLDSLRVDGKRRRRRTAEDTLTAEEIAEYMGCDSRSPSEGGTLSSSSTQIACRYCGEVAVDLSRYFSHTLLVHGAYICHQCGKSFTTKSSLLRHRPIHTGMRRFACSICRKAFYRKDKCKAHIKRHLGIGEGPVVGGRASLLASPDQQPTYSGGPVDVAV